MLRVFGILFLLAGSVRADHHWRFDPQSVTPTAIQPIAGKTPLPWGPNRKVEQTAPHGWTPTATTFLEVPADVAPKLRPTEAFTVSAWVRTDRFPDWTGILSAIEDNGGEESGWMLGLKGRSPCFAVAGKDSADADGTLTYIVSPRFADAGRWVFICGRYDGDSMRLFVDGKPVAASNAQSGAILYPENVRFTIGAYVDRNETYPLTGPLGELWLDHSALSDEKIAARYETTRKKYPAGPVGDVDPLGGFPVTRWKPAPEALKPATVTDRRVPTDQWIRPAGETLVYPGRPVDLAISPDGTIAAVKDNSAVMIFDVKTWTARQRLPFPSGGASMHGVLFSADGKRLWVTTAQKSCFEGTVEDGWWTWSREIPLPGPGGGNSAPCGIAHDAKTDRLYVCLSLVNAVAEIDLSDGTVLRTFPVSIAPYDVLLLPDGNRLVVSNWGGRRPKDDEKTATSGGTPVLIDDRGIARSGTVGLVDLKTGRQTREVATGLHPADLKFDTRTGHVYVANANSDSISIIDPETLAIQATVSTRPNENLPYGSATNALAFSSDGNTLFAANGGNNAVAVLKRSGDRPLDWTIAGFVPTAWYPGAVGVARDSLIVSNVKGIGSRADSSPEKRRVHAHSGAVSKVVFPTPDGLKTLTERVRANINLPRILRARERETLTADVPARPVPRRLGEPSPIKHVVYVIKENRTYDQVFGDLPQGDGEPKLCIFPRKITPNHHRLAEQFVLLDNFYCNGVNSADGHSWATEGNVTDHLEKSFGGFTRSYTFGDDPLTYSSTGFIWDNVLLHGLSFRNYGEMDYASPVPANSTFEQIYRDFVEGTNRITFTKKIGIETLARHTCPDYPGWNMRIPDVLRVAAFKRELAAAEKSGEWYDFMIVFLPQDHCSGLSRGMPRPESHMADNDLALGQLVEAISNSRFWPETAIFVIEDDPQAGFDHIDGHRSICLVASPYTRRGAVVSKFYNQTSVLHTMQRILGIPPMNQLDAASPLMTECFTEKPDLTPYRAVVPTTPLDRLAGDPESAPPGMKRWYVATAGEDFEGFDRADEDTLNRILWHALRGANTPYPADWAGAHGRGLKDRGLIITGDGDDDDDDD